MGLDIYAGTLTRYYSHNWKTVVQQWAEENGYTFNRITPDGEPADNEEELSPAEVQAAVEDWREQRPLAHDFACKVYSEQDGTNGRCWKWQQKRPRSTHEGRYHCH